MTSPQNRRYQTSLEDFLCDLFSFVEECLTNAAANPVAAQAQFTKAGSVISVILDRLKLEDTSKITQLQLVGLLPEDLDRLALLSAKDLAAECERINEAICELLKSWQV
jgi:hypothetical protein